MRPDVFRQMAQMSYVTADGSAQGQGPWNQTNKLSVES